MNFTPCPPIRYQVFVNGQVQGVRTCRVAAVPGAEWHRLSERPHPTPSAPVTYCHLEIEAAAVIEVVIGEAEDLLESVTVRPLRHGILPEIQGNRITFPVDGPGHLVVEPNGSLDCPLFLFISPVSEPAPQPAEVTRYFGPGEHVVGVLPMASGDRIYLHPDAVVRGHLVGDELEDVRIFGHGTIDTSKSPGLGDPLPRKNEYGAHRPLLSFRDSTNIRIEGVHLIDSPAWTCQLFNCTNVHINDVRIISCRENGDGIDVVNGEHVLIENCFLRTWDDALCLKTQLSCRGDHGLLWTAIGMGNPGGLAWNHEALGRLQTYRTHDVTMRNCVVWLDRAHALEIGFETTGIEVSQIRFEDIDIVHDFHYAPMDISVSDRADVHDVIFRRIHIEDSRAPYVAQLFVGDTYCSVDRWFGIDFGRIRQVLFEDIHVHASELLPVQIHARPLSAPRLPTEFTPLCDGLTELPPETLPKGLSKTHPRARREGEPLVEDIVFRNWTLHRESGESQVTPTVLFTEDSQGNSRKIETSELTMCLD